MTRSVYGGVEVQVFFSTIKQLACIICLCQGYALSNLKNLLKFHFFAGRAGEAAPWNHTHCLHTNCSSGLSAYITVIISVKYRSTIVCHLPDMNPFYVQVVISHMTNYFKPFFFEAGI